MTGSLTRLETALVDRYVTGGLAVRPFETDAASLRSPAKQGVSKGGVLLRAGRSGGQLGTSP
jgi:hypothetical protein